MSGSIANFQNMQTDGNLTTNILSTANNEEYKFEKEEFKNMNNIDDSTIA